MLLAVSTSPSPLSGLRLRRSCFKTGSSCSLLGWSGIKPAAAEVKVSAKVLRWASTSDTALTFKLWSWHHHWDGGGFHHYLLPSSSPLQPRCSFPRTLPCMQNAKCPLPLFQIARLHPYLPTPFHLHLTRCLETLHVPQKRR